MEREPYGSRFASRSGEARHQPLAFPGQEEGGGDGSSYNIFRWYRAGWGQYAQPDRLGVTVSANLYGYSAENPLRFADPLGLVTVHMNHMPDQTMTRDQFRNYAHPGGIGGQNDVAGFMSGRRVSCTCSGSLGCVKMSVTIDASYYFILTTDAGNALWPPAWQQRIEEGIHADEFIQSTNDLARLAEQHEAQRYMTRAGCEVDCWRLRNYSRLTRWLPGFEEQFPGLNPHPGGGF